MCDDKETSASRDADWYFSIAHHATHRGAIFRHAFIRIGKTSASESMRMEKKTFIFSVCKFNKLSFVWLHVHDCILFVNISEKSQFYCYFKVIMENVVD